MRTLLLASAFLVMLCCQVPARCSPPVSDKAEKEQLYRAVLELSGPDEFPFDVETIIATATKALHSNKLSPAERAGLLIRRGDAYSRSQNTHLKAKEDYIQALKLFPGKGIILSKLIFLMLYLESPPAALQQAIKWIDSHPTEAQLYPVASLAAILSEDFPRAIDFATKGIALDQGLTAAYFFRARAYHGLGELEKALADLTVMLAAAPLGTGFERSAAGYVLRGLVLRGLGKGDQAINNFLMARKLAPKEPDILFQLALTYAAQDKYYMALAVARELMSQAPDTPEALIALSAAYSGLGEVGEILKLTEQYLQRNPKDVEAWHHLGAARAALKEYQAAIAAFDKALGHDPTHSPTKAAKAFLLATCPDPRFRNGDAAIRLATEACKETSFGRPVFLVTLACAYAEGGRFEQARQFLGKAQKMVGSNLLLRRRCHHCHVLFLSNMPYRHAEEVDKK